MTDAEWRGRSIASSGVAAERLGFGRAGSIRGRPIDGAPERMNRAVAARTLANWAWFPSRAFRRRNRQIRNPMGKTRGKTTRKSAKSGEKWRFFETLKRHFAVLGAEVAQAQAIHARSFISVKPGRRDPPKVPRIRCTAPFSNRARPKPTTPRSPGEGRSDLTRRGPLRQKRYD